MADGKEEGLVATDADLQVLVGQRRPLATQPDAFCGFLKFIRPGSGSGLTETMSAPFFFATSRWLSIRGAFVPGFWPTTTISSDSSSISSVTAPLPLPITRVSAVPEDSWHMFEQSGRLFVPYARTNS